MGFKIPKMKTGIKLLDRATNKIAQGTAMIYGQKDPFKAKSPGLPGESPQVTALREKMQGEAVDYRSKLPGMINEQDNLLKVDAQNAEGAGVHATRKNMNDRGLLYSGLRESSEGDVRSRVATGLARSQADVRKSFEDTAAAKENTAAQVGLSGYNDALKRSSDLYNQQMEKSTNARQNMQALGQAGGYAAGAYSRGGFNQPQQAQAQAPAQVGSSYAARPSDYDYYGQPQGLLNA